MEFIREWCCHSAVVLVVLKCYFVLWHPALRYLCMCLTLSFCLLSFPPQVQGSCVQVLPPAVWDHAVRPDPRAPGRSQKVLPAHRPSVQHCTAAWARTGTSADTRGAGDGHGGGRGGRGRGPVMLHRGRPGTQSSSEASTSDLCAVALCPSPGFCRTLGLNSRL